MGILFGGAIVFSYLEDPEPTNNDGQDDNVTGENSTEEKYVFETVNRTNLWVALQRKYNLVNISFDDQTIENFLIDIDQHLETVKEEKIMQQREEDRKDRLKIFRKWFYFANIATTTIGK